VRVHADDHALWCEAHSSPPMLDPIRWRAGRAALLRAEQTALEPLPALGDARGLRRPNESHTDFVGSRNESDSPGA
jgi:hypothetical protein